MKEYKFLYRRAVIEQPTLDGRRSYIAGPAGTGHIFPFTRDKDNGNLVTAGLALCGRLDLGEFPYIYAHRIQTLPICEHCLAAWKADPTGPYARWIQGATGQKPRRRKP